MDPRELIETRSHREVTEFVEQNNSCTVGLHGSRGMGKTALMLRLQKRHFGRGASVRITSPSLREPAELPRIVLMALAKQLAPANEPLPAKWALTLVAGGVVTFLTSGLALSFLSTKPGVPFGEWVGAIVLRDPGVWAAMLALGALVIVFSLGAFMVIGLSSVATARGRSKSIASEIIERYTSEVEASSTTGVGVAALLGFSMTGARTRRALPARHADVVDDVERLVRAYRGSSKKRTVLVLIDELDRLPVGTIELLLNEIKDFFHMDGVRVVVSVSDEVLTSFHGRRTSPTDVFDSSFDTVVEMRAMSPRESVAMMNDRVIAVPPRVTHLCHALSGGRPRELLRACRTFVRETWGSKDIVDVRDSDSLGVGLVDRSQILSAAIATIDAIALEECHRLQRVSGPGSRERRLSDKWAAEVESGNLPKPGRRAREVHPNSARLFVALSLIRRHLAPWVATPAPTTGPDPLLPLVAALAAVMAAVQAEERVWRASVAEVSKVVGEMPREAEA
jgi:GTPase SAR1 family protein